jgi:hypothetical protein
MRPACVTYPHPRTRLRPTDDTGHAPPSPWRVQAGDMRIFPRGSRPKRRVQCTLYASDPFMVCRPRHACGMQQRAILEQRGMGKASTTRIDTRLSKRHLCPRCRPDSSGTRACSGQGRAGHWTLWCHDNHGRHYDGSCVPLSCGANSVRLRPFPQMALVKSVPSIFFRSQIIAE